MPLARAARSLRCYLVYPSRPCQCRGQHPCADAPASCAADPRAPCRSSRRRRYPGLSSSKDRNSLLAQWDCPDSISLRAHKSGGCLVSNAQRGAKAYALKLSQSKKPSAQHIPGKNWSGCPKRRLIDDTHSTVPRSHLQPLLRIQSPYREALLVGLSCSSKSLPLVSVVGSRG